MRSRRDALLDPCEFSPGTPASVISIAMYFEEKVERKIDPKERSVIRRLALDPRMPAVWRQLRRRRRDGDRLYLYPADREYLCGYDPAWATASRDSVQEFALALLFSAAVWSVFTYPAISKARLEERARPYLAMAAQLRKTRQQFEMLDIEMGDELATLDDLIVSCEIHASRLGAGRVVFDRDRGDTRLKGCLANLAAEMLGLFGMVPRRLLAMIASVALDQKVTPAMAREACRWAVKEAERECLTTYC